MGFSSPYFDEMLGYWRSLCTDDDIPSATAFDLICIPKTLPNLTFWDLTPQDQIICRMAGTHVVERMRSDITGANLCDVVPTDIRPLVSGIFKAILTHKCGIWYVVHNRHISGKIVRLECLALPLAASNDSCPKFVVHNHPLETISYDKSRTGQVELGLHFDARCFMDVGWGAPAQPWEAFQENP